MSEDIENKGKIVGLDGKPVPKKRGRKPGYKQTPFTREKIRATQLMNEAHKIALGEKDCSPSQARLLCALLGKVVPDMKSVEHSAPEGQKAEIKIVTGIDRDGTDG
jgi:hypothetical protein